MAYLETLPGPQPTGIVGLIGACAGWSTKEVSVHQRELHVGAKLVRLQGYLQEISRIKNLKRADSKKPSDGSTVVLRQSLVGVSYQFFILSENNQLLENLANAIKRPVFTTYLGNSECLCTLYNLTDIRELNPREIKETNAFFPTRPMSRYVMVDDKNVRFIPPKTYFCMKTIQPDGSPETFEEIVFFYNFKVTFKQMQQGWSLDGTEFLTL